jgi:hypothetical protein
MVPFGPSGVGAMHGQAHPAPVRTLAACPTQSGALSRGSDGGVCAAGC